MSKKNNTDNNEVINTKSMFNHSCMYISSTLPYPNEKGHIGHAFEFVLADFFKRYYNEINIKNDIFNDLKIKFSNDNQNMCFLNTGIDEHGQKMFQSSMNSNLNPQEHCDKMAIIWKEFCSNLNMSYDNFYRTSSDKHKKLSQDYLYLIREHIYEKEYSGKYCNNCESFKTEKEIVNNRCPLHSNIELQEVIEKNFFFPLTKFKNFDVDNILVDKSLLLELKSIIENHDDLSISRENVSWGIPIPFSNQTMYVFFEALLNYVFAIGYTPSLLNFLEFSNLWKNSLIICGKDNLKFQAFILPAILKAGGITPPHKVLVHGMILDKNGIKMSKSLNNVIHPVEQVEKYNLNAIRYYFLAGLNTFQDSNYSEEDLVFKYNNDLCNNLGNLISRVSSIIERDVIGQQICIISPIKAPELYNTEFLNLAQSKIAEAHNEIVLEFNTKNCFNILNALLNDANKYYTEQRPFDKESTNTIQVIQEMVCLFILIAPFYESVSPGFNLIISKINQGKVIPFTKIEIEKNGRK